MTGATGATGAAGVVTDSNFNLKADTSALSALTSGLRNNAEGYQALSVDTSGSDNVAVGYQSLFGNVSGSYNVALGSKALNLLNSQTTASTNIAIGYSAGAYLTQGGNNIYLGTPGKSGTTSESDTIRIGQQAADATVTPNVAPHTKTFIAGIYGTQTASFTGSSVLIDNNGQLGVQLSSRRYKENIQPMADASERLFKLRPVTFQYRNADVNGDKPIQYGLIAEEVAEVFPELVVRNKDGSAETVAYHLLGGLLLNELQKEHAVVGHQAEELEALRQQAAEVQALRAEVGQLRGLRHELDELRQVTARLIKKSTPKALKSSHRPTEE